MKSKKLQTFSYKSLFIILFFLLISIVLLLRLSQRPNPASAGWFNDSWSYRQTVAIVNSAGSTLTNQRVKIILNTATLYSAKKIQSDCDDIRVTDNKGNILEHWETNCNNASTNIYVKIPSIPTTDTNLYVYYGNPSAPSIETTLGTANNPGTSCKMMTDQGSITANGIYYITPGGNNADTIQIYCNVNTLSQSWSLVLNNNGALTTNPEPNWNDAINSVNTTGTYGSNISAFDLILGLKHWNYLGSTALVQTGTSPSALTRQASYSSISLNAGNNYSISLGTETLHIGTTTPGIKSHASNGGYQFSTYDADHDTHADSCSSFYGNSPWWYSSCWSGSFWGGGDGGGYQNKPYWLGAADDYHDYGAIYVGGSDTMKNVTATIVNTEETGGGPIAYWKFDEGFGSTASNSISTTRNGTLQNGTAWQTEDLCLSGKCLKFDGVNDYVSVGIGTDFFPLSTFSICTWIKTPGLAPGMSLNGIISLTYGLSMSINGSGQPWSYMDDGSNLISSTVTTVNLYDNKFHHVCLTYDGTNRHMYIDGVNKKTQATTWQGTTRWPTNTCNIGHENNNSPIYKFNGTIDEVKIYPYARTAAQVKSDYNAGKSRASSNKGTSASLGGNTKSGDFLSDGLIGYWKMDEGTMGNGTTFVDSSGNGNTGTGVSSVTVTSGKFGNGVDIPGSGGGGLGSAININDSNSLDIGYTTPMTISFWLNADSTACGAIIKKSGLWEIYRCAANLTIRFDGYDQNSSFNLNNGQWYLITVTRDPSTSTTKVYINGKQTDSWTYAISSSPDYSGNMGIGAYFGGAWSIDGKVDEVRIYNRALSSNEVTQLYNWAPGPVAYYNFEENSGTAVVDKSGNNFNGNFGTGTSAPTWFSGKYGAGVKFDGNDSINIGTSIFSPTNGSQEYTIGAWIKTSSVGQDPIITQYSNGAPADRFGFRLNNGYITWWKGGNFLATSANTVNSNTWRYVTGTRDSSGNIKLYVDGVVSGAGGTDPLGFEATNTYIGIFNAIVPYTGLMDELKVYNYVRTQKQIIEDMNADHPAGGSPVGSQVGYWKFDEGFGTVAKNSGNQGLTLNANFGAGNSIPTWTNDGKFNKALSFVTPNSYALISNSSILNNSSSFTASAWVKSNDTSQNQTILSANPPFFLRISGSRFRIGIYTNSVWTFVNGSTPLSNNTWYHLTLVYDGTNMKSYINGVLDINTPKTGVLASFTNMYLGYAIPAGENYSFNGIIDEVKVYNYALTDDEIKIDYNRNSAIQLGSLSSGSGNTAPSTSGSQEYCVPGDSSTCLPPIAEWKFEENSGSVAYNTVGNGNNGTIGSGTSAPSWVPGKFGSALKFTGSDNKLPLNSSINIGNTDWTVSAWVKTTNTGVNSILSNRSGGPVFNDLRTDASKIVYHHYNGAWISEYGTSNIADGKWHFLTWVNHSNQTIDLYVDGVGETFGAPSTLSNGSLGPVDQIGRNWATSANASIDQVRVYNYARSPAQISWEYNRGGPIGYWKFEECQGNIARDSSGNNNNGTIVIGASGTQNSLGTCQVGTSAAWTNGAAGKINSAMSFDGADDYVSIPYIQQYNIRKAITLSIWMKRTTGFDQLTDVFLLSRPPAWYFYDAYNSGSVRGDVYIDGVRRAALTVPVPFDGNWYQVVYTYDSDSHIARIYKNGTLTNSTTLSGLSNYLIDSSLANLVNMGQNSLGRGMILDDARIYNYALTSTQIKTLYNNGAASFSN